MMSKDQQDMMASETLLATNEQRYGAEYKDHYLTLYRDYVASADAISSRRNNANSFFLTINSAFLGALGMLGDRTTTPEFASVQAIVGVLFCLVWWRMIQSYRTLNGSKFDVIQLMEKHLPLAAYTAEELVQNTGPTLHRALSTVESYVPALFGLLHLAAAIASLG